MAEDLRCAQELATLEYSMLRYAPSVLAAAAVLVAEAHDEVAAVAAAAALQVRCSPCLLPTGCPVAQAVIVSNACGSSSLYGSCLSSGTSAVMRLAAIDSVHVCLLEPAGLSCERVGRPMIYRASCQQLWCYSCINRPN